MSETQVRMPTFLLRTVDDFIAFATRSGHLSHNMPLHPQIYFPRLRVENVHKITYPNTNYCHYHYQYKDLGGVKLLPGETIADVYSKLVPIKSEYKSDQIRFDCYITENKNAVNADLMSMLISASKTIGDIITFIAGPATIIQTLIVISERWEKKHSQSKSSNQSSVVSPPSSKTPSDITAIRLHWTNGTETEFDEWLTHPDHLKNHIDAFLSNPSMKPTEAIFILKNGKCIIVNVTMGATNNSPLEDILTYLS